MSCRLWWFLLFLSKFQWFSEWFFLSLLVLLLLFVCFFLLAYCRYCIKKTFHKEECVGQYKLGDRPCGHTRLSSRAHTHNKHWDFFFVCIVFFLNDRKCFVYVKSKPLFISWFLFWYFRLREWEREREWGTLHPPQRDEMNTSCCWQCSKTHA